MLPVWTDFSLIRSIRLWTEIRMDNQPFSFPWQLWNPDVLEEREKVSLLVGDDFESPKLQETIQTYHRHFFSLLWCHWSIPKEIVKLCCYYEIKIWRHPDTKSMRIVKEPISLDAFVIVWNSLKKDTLKSILRLRHLFEEKGYTGLYLSRSNYGYLHSCMYMESPGTVRKLVKQFSPDLVLIDAGSINQNTFRWDIMILESEQGTLRIKTDQSELKEVFDLEGAFDWIIREAAEEQCEKREV